MTKDTNIKLNMTFEEALGRFISVCKKDITGIEEVSDQKIINSLAFY